MVLTLCMQLTLVVFFLSSTGADILHLHSWWSSFATCTGDVTCQLYSLFIDAHKHKCYVHSMVMVMVVLVLVVVVVCREYREQDFELLVFKENEIS